MPNSCILSPDYSGSKPSVSFDEIFEKKSGDPLTPPRLMRTSQGMSSIARNLLEEFDQAVTPKQSVIGPIANLSGEGWKSERYWSETAAREYPLQ